MCYVQHTETSELFDAFLDSFFLIIVIMFHIAVNNFYFLYTKLLVYYDLVIEMLLIRNATAAFTILAN